MFYLMDGMYPRHQHSYILKRSWDVLIMGNTFYRTREPYNEPIITYYPGSKALAKTQDLLSNNINGNALVFYQKRLDQVIRNHDRSWRLSLAELLQPLFLLAYQRSTLTVMSPSVGSTTIRPM